MRGERQCIFTQSLHSRIARAQLSQRKIKVCSQSTGFGKSLIFSNSPSRPQRAVENEKNDRLVVTPLVSIMKEQVLTKYFIDNTTLLPSHDRVAKPPGSEVRLEAYRILRDKTKSVLLSNMHVLRQFRCECHSFSLPQETFALLVSIMKEQVLTKYFIDNTTLLPSHDRVAKPPGSEVRLEAYRILRAKTKSVLLSNIHVLRQFRCECHSFSLPQETFALFFF